MARAHLKDRVLDASGNAIQNASVTVYEAGTTTPIAATMFANRTGGTTKSNPLTTAADGSFEFYLDAGQRVNLKINAAGMAEYTEPDVPVLDDPAEMMDLDRAQSTTGTKTIPNAVLATPTITGGTISGTAISGAMLSNPTLSGDVQVTGDLLAGAMEHDATGIIYTDPAANLAAWNPKLRVTEPGSNGTLTYDYTKFRAHTIYNLTEPTATAKAGIVMEIGNTAASRSVDAGAGELAGVTDPIAKRFQVISGIIVFCNAQKDNGGDSSAISGIQWANGNAGSFLKAWSGRPAYWGAPNEPVSLLYGYALESGAELYSTVIDSAVYDNGIGHVVGVGATSGTGSSGVTEYGQGRVVYPYTSTVDLDTGLITAGLNLDKRLVDRVTAASAPGRYQHQYDTWKHTIDGKISQYSMFDDSTTTPGSPVYHRMVTQKTATDARTPEWQVGYRERMVGPGGGASASGAPNTEKFFGAFGGYLRDAANNSAGGWVFSTRHASSDGNLTNDVFIEGGLLGVGVRPTAFTLEVLGAVGPGDDATRDLGSGAKRWRDIYASRDLVAATRVYTAGQVYTNGFTGANRTGMLQYTAAPSGETWGGMWYDNAVTALRIGAITQGTAYRDVHILTETGNVGKVLIGASGSSVGLYGTAGVGRQTVTGSRASGAALADLLTKLAATGLIVDGSSA